MKKLFNMGFDEQKAKETSEHMTVEYVEKKKPRIINLMDQEPPVPKNGVTYFIHEDSELNPGDLLVFKGGHGYFVKEEDEKYLDKMTNRVEIAVVSPQWAYKAMIDLLIACADGALEVKFLKDAKHEAH